MGDKVLTETDIHWIVKIFQKSSSLILNKDLVCGALGLTLAEIEEIDRRIQMDRSSTYKHFSLVVSKWIEKNSAGATLSKLALILRSEEFTSTADELLRTVERSPKIYTANDDTGNGATTTTAKKNSDEVKIPSSPMNKVQNISTTGKDKLPSTTNKTKGNVATFVKLFDNVGNSRVPKVSRVNVEPSDLRETMNSAGICELERVELSDAQNGQLSSSNGIVELKGSQIEFDSFLGVGRRNYSTLKSIEFNNVEMNWGVFWDSVARIKTLETIRLNNMNLLPFTPARKALLPNLRRYALNMDEDSSGDILRTLEQSRKNHGEVYLVDYLIPFAKGNLGEDIWSTCLSLKYVRLDLVISPEVIFQIDKDNFEFYVDRIFVEHRQDSNETQCSILPKFFQSFQELKKLALRNDCGIAGYIDFSSFPSSLTHFQLVDSVTSIRDGDLDVALKRCRELVYLEVGDPTFTTTKHTLDLANLSPEIRCLRLDNTSIACSSPSEFNHLSVLCLYGSHFHPSVNVPFIFRNVKKCCFVYRQSDPIFTGLKNWLEMDSLEFIFIWGLRIDKDDEVRGILKSYGVPHNSEDFALKRNGKKQWKFVNESEKDPWDIFAEILTQAWDDTLK